MLTQKAGQRRIPAAPHRLMHAFMLIGSIWLSADAGAFSNTIQVTTTADTAVVDSQCSLREAITNANDNALTFPECLYGAGSLVIVFDTGLGIATINLDSTLPAITHVAGLTIEGADRITIRYAGASFNRLITVNPGALLTLNHVTISGGRAYSACGGGSDNVGGGILNNGALAVTNSTFNDNRSYSNCAAGYLGFGGGIYSSGTLVITNSTFSNNAAGKSGGAVYNAGGTATITNSAFVGNSSGSSAGTDGGSAIRNGGALILANSTFSSNSAGGRGAGVANTNSATLTNNTFSGNLALSGADIYNSGTLNLYNTILANSLGGGNCVNAGGTITATYNLNQDIANGCSLALGPGGNKVGVSPSLGTLTGSPAYFPLLPNSVAIDGGDDAHCVSPPVSSSSQNGTVRPQGSHCDIGAYEFPAQFIDIDGDGHYNGLTDGLLLLRYLMGVRGATLIQGAVAPGALRTTAADIEQYIQALMP